MATLAALFSSATFRPWQLWCSLELGLKKQATAFQKFGSPSRWAACERQDTVRRKGLTYWGHAPGGQHNGRVQLEVEIQSNMVWMHTPPPYREDNSYMEEKNSCTSVADGASSHRTAIMGGKLLTNLCNS
jgi:hypothetical protein